MPLCPAINIPKPKGILAVFHFPSISFVLEPKAEIKNDRQSFYGEESPRVTGNGWNPDVHDFRSGSVSAAANDTLACNHPETIVTVVYASLAYDPAEIVALTPTLNSMNRSN
ncbi:hypothetical protein METBISCDRAFT_22271 [Metschnikowia bicuspidata]|uniref:Uncharacterized protein n=1 Tax=Metschnikowia bicuspidata TaxID=27322 RepID=A0A4P9ZFC1_9ASCO|nr:hypothetical protein METBISCDRAFT_22271 [Metschnikowia bicuspidata]